jgi:outer membrane receptor protein involved in Fe transport
VTVPGHYGSVSVTAARDYIEERGIGASINGYSVAVRPFSYFASVDRTLGDSRINRVDADGTMRAAGETAVVGLGLRPVHELGLFAFGTRSSYGGRIAEQLSGLTDEDFEFDYRRYDVGANFRINPTNHVWLKLGHGTEAVPVSGALLSQRTADTLNAGLGPLLGVTFQPLGALDRFHYDLVQRDAQFRHTLDASSGVQLTWGVERASESKPLVTVVTFAPLQIGLEQTNRLESDGAYVSGRFRVADAIEVQADLHHQDFLSSFHNTSFFRLNNGAPVALPPAAGTTRRREINPRFGLKWSLAPFHTLRAAVQSWRRPPGVNTLAPVDTVGVALDDRIERAGGKLERGRLQQDVALSERTFLQLFADTKRVANLETAGAGIVPDLNLEQLETLRNRRRVYGIEQDYLEAAPDFSAGRASLAGGAVNHLATTRTAASARYVYARTKNSSAAFNGLPLPFHPRHYLNLAVNWQPSPRWVVGASGTYRTRRSADEGGTTMLENGWTAGLQAYWESEDKRLSLAGVIEHIRSRSGASYYRSPAAHVQAIYRF